MPRSSDLPGPRDSATMARTASDSSRRSSPRPRAVTGESRSAPPSGSPTASGPRSRTPTPRTSPTTTTSAIPFTLRYAKIFRTQRSNGRIHAEYGYSDRDQRHRVKGWLLWRMPLDIDFNVRYAYLSAQPQSLTAHGRRRPDAAGSHQPGRHGRRSATRAQRQRVLDRSTCGSRACSSSDSSRSSPSIDVFNLFNAKNFSPRR